MCGSKFKYYMVFEHKDMEIQGSYTMDSKEGEKMEKTQGRYFLPEGDSMAGKNILFISYRHKDIAYLTQVLDLLINRTEYAIWYDDNLSAGERFDDEIKDVIKRSVVMVQLVTPSYFEDNSYTFLKEVPFSKEVGTKIAAICMENDSNTLHIIRESKPDFLCCIWDKDSVESFLCALNNFNVPINMEEKIYFYNKKVNCDYITPNEMFQLAKAFADGCSVEIHKEEAIRYARMGTLCHIEGAQELLHGLETTE